MIKSPVSSLANRFLRIVTLCAAGYLVIVLAIVIPRGFVEAEQAHQALKEKLVLSLANSASIALFVNNHEIADEVMSALLLHDEINAVRLRSNEDVLFERVKAGEFEQGVWQRASRYPLVSPVDAQPLGAIYIHDNQEVLQQQTVKLILEQVLVVSIQFVLTWIAIGVLVRTLVGKPLTQLSDALLQLKPGDPSKITLDKRNQNNEIGLVTASINQFIDSAHMALLRERELRSQIERWEVYYRNMAEQDTLTGLKNRLGCEKYVTQVSGRTEYLGLLLIDLDGFKEVNDRFGHAAGDVVLTVIANRFQMVTQKHFADFAVGRLGGDEFVIYTALPEYDEPGLAKFAEQIVRQANRAIDSEMNQFHVGCSVGITLAKSDFVDLDKMLHQADQAMYQVKQQGKNGYQIYHQRALHCRD